MKVVNPIDVEARLQALVAELRARAQRLADARGDLRRSENAWRDQAAHTVESAAANSRQTLTRTRKGIEANVAEARAQAIGVATRSIEQGAPLYLGADWSSDVWVTLPAARTGAWLRVGTVQVDQGRLPFALPLAAGVWSVAGADPATFRTLVQNTVARLLAAFDAPRLRVLAYDPGLTLDLAVFAGIRPVSAASVPPAVTSVEAFERALDDLLADVATATDRITAAGLSSYWSALESGHALAATVPFRLVAIGGTTEHLTERGLSRLGQLRTLAADRGLLVIEWLPTAAPQRQSGGGPGTLVTVTGQSATATAVPGVSWALDPWAGDGFIRGLCARLVARPRPSLAPVLDFADIIDSIEDSWLGEADEGLDAVIGRRDAGDLVVRLRSENPPMPNALVGGAVGEGKSNLLLVLIHALAGRYSPADLEMVLVDLRDGVEFARLGPSHSSRTWLPHVRALGLEFDPDYSVAVLQWVLDRMSERADLLKDTGTTTLGQYRRATGKVIPRLLVVIDEFQRLFEGDDDRVAEAASLLERIARTGRGFGVHLVLASQAITGIRGLAVKQDAIFGQFRNRISLRNTAVESQAVLSAHNLAPRSWSTVGRSWSTTASEPLTATGSARSRTPSRSIWRSSRRGCSPRATTARRRASSGRRRSPIGRPATRRRRPWQAA